MHLKPFFFLSLLFIIINPFSAQILFNGDFSSGTANWGCGVEVNTESTYGGGSSNAVVEVDAGAGLCQTMTGLIIGNAYLVSFSSSRRTGGCPSPAVTNIDVNVSGGVLSTTITRTNTTFGFISDYFIFIANATTHTLTFSAGAGFGGSTCGMIMDNFVVSFSPLPITLLNFNAVLNGERVEIRWSTASEKNNSYFIIERSSDGEEFSEVQKIPSQTPFGNSSMRLDYSAVDSDPLARLSYYRLKQVDRDGTFSYSKIVFVDEKTSKKINLYPNPNSGEFTLDARVQGKITVSILNNLAETVYSETQFISSASESVKILAFGKLTPGFYQCLVKSIDAEVSFPLIIR